VPASVWEISRFVHTNSSKNTYNSVVAAILALNDEITQMREWEEIEVGETRQILMCTPTRTNVLFPLIRAREMRKII